MTTKILKRSPHFGQHVAYGAKKFFDFAGWEMPLHFSTLEEEVLACRNAAVVFDGHAMGEVHVKGPEALKAMQKLCANDISRVQPGRCTYTSMLTEAGGIFDDFVAFCLAPDHYLLTVAAFNVHKSPGWIERHIQGMNAYMCDQSAGTTCLEIQGPRSREVLRRIAEFDVSNEALPYYGFVFGKVAGIDALVARLGVTGELGYEIFYDPGYAYTMYDAIMTAGKGLGLVPCGNGTVRIYRLEKVYHIYTRDIDESTNPFEAGLDRWVRFDKGHFIGREALLRIKEDGIKRRLVGFAVADSEAAQGGDKILAEGQPAGQVTSGGFSPTLQKSIGLGYVAIEHARIGTDLIIQRGDHHLPATVVEIPFYDPKGTRIRM